MNVTEIRIIETKIDNSQAYSIHFFKEIPNTIWRKSDITFESLSYTTYGRARRSGAHIRLPFSLRKESLIIFSIRLIHFPSRHSRFAMFTIRVYRPCVFCEVCARAEGTVKHRECNTTSTTDGSTVIRKINPWFIFKIKKRPLKEAVEQRVNIAAVC